MLSVPCDRDDHGACFPDEPPDCGCECHPLDGPAASSTGNCELRRAQAPKRAAVEPFAPEPAPVREPGSSAVPADADEPGTPSRPALPSSPLSRVREPEGGTQLSADTFAAHAGEARPGRDVDPATPRPGTGEQDQAAAEGLSGAEWRKKAKAATSARNAALRRKAGRYTRIGDRTAGSQYKPGMAVVRPPETGEGRSVGNHPAGRKLPPQEPGPGDAA